MTVAPPQPRPADEPAPAAPDPRGLLVDPIARVEPRPADPYAAPFPDLTGFVEEFAGSPRKLRICIATEDIVGPIRNGGIGTTYTHLAKRLVEEGHEPTIAYLRGDHCENKSMAHWVEWYRQAGVRFVPIDPTTVDVVTPASRWVNPMLALYEFLKQESFDAVHVSEWRGLAMPAMLARKQGLALQDTAFLVKASSPWLWNREHGYHTLNRPTDLPKMFAEMRSIELGDVVIGGSRHLLRWMLEHGYRMPPRSHSQPNVIVPPKSEELDALREKRRGMAGTRMPIDELVFFGRLEYRKGLDVFCDAIDRLVAEGIELPKIALMGKYGEPIPSWPEYPTQEYLKVRTKAWPVEVTLLTNYNTEQAVTYLLSGDRLAVMPSVIENSSLAVYEAASFGIPCIASDRGGTPELVIDEHHDAMLIEPHPVKLAEKLKEAIAQGGFIAEPTFDNGQNLQVWRDFHDHLGSFVEHRSAELAQRTQAPPTVAACLVLQDNHEHVAELLAALEPAEAAGDVCLVIANDGSTRPETRAWWEELKGHDAGSRTLLDEPGYGEQHAANAAARASQSDVLVFIEQGAVPDAEAIGMIRQAAATSDAEAFGGFFRSSTPAMRERGDMPRLHASFVADQSTTFFGLQRLSPVLAIRRQTFAELGGFSEDHKIPGALAEMFMTAKLSDRVVETIPESLATVDEGYKRHRRVNELALSYRTARPFVQLGPQCFSRVLLTARAAGDLFGDGAQSGPLASVDGMARDANETFGSSPLLRRIGMAVYHQQNRLYYNFVKLEIMCARGARKLMKAIGL
ncbi:MAG: glycosyltransferase family 4 protein [Planctomycetota bacterium]